MLGSACIRFGDSAHVGIGCRAFGAGGVIQVRPGIYLWCFFFPGTLSYEDQADAQESYASAQPWAAGLRAPGHDMHHPPMQTTSSVRA